MTILLTAQHLGLDHVPPGCLREAFVEVEVDVHADPLVDEGEAEGLGHADIQTTDTY